jgi:hypothetical protein
MAGDDHRPRRWTSSSGIPRSRSRVAKVRRSSCIPRGRPSCVRCGTLACSRTCRQARATLDGCRGVPTSEANTGVSSRESGHGCGHRSRLATWARWCSRSRSTACRDSGRPAPEASVFGLDRTRPVLPVTRAAALLMWCRPSRTAKLPPSRSTCRHRRPRSLLEDQFAEGQRSLAELRERARLAKEAR